MNTGNVEKSPAPAPPASDNEPRPKRYRGPAANKFAKTCKRILQREGERIADALFARAVAGDVTSAKLLIKIIENEARNIRARRLAAERRNERERKQK